MNCPHCKAPIAAEARFCPACGKATPAPESLAGKEIGGRYRIIAKLGEGGMGAVYRGEQISLKRAVAVKLLKPELGSNQMVLRRFNAEAEAVAKLSHPNTVNIYDFGQDTDGSLFIAMEFIEGRSLREALQKEGPFPPTRAIAIALQVAASLSDAHSHNIVHRDLKPDNVMLQDRGRHKDVVRVLDFGIAKLRDDNRQTAQAMTQAGDMLGTPQYMAPEQIKGEHVDGRVDIYALGCMIYEMLTARLPFEAPTVMAMLSKHLMETPLPPSQRRRDLMIPPQVEQLVMHAMAKEAAARPATMDQFSEMLQAVLATLPADPNRSAGMSVQQSVATPTAPSAFQPPTFPPPQFPTPHTGPAFAPPTSPPPSGSSSSGPAITPAHYPQPQSFAGPTASTKRSSKAPIFIVLGLLALGGAGVGVYFATREDAKPKADPWADPQPQPTPEPEQPPKEDPWAEENKEDKEEAPPGPDPWGAQGAAPAPAPTPSKAASKIGTNATPIPKGARLVVGRGFQSQINDGAHVHVHPSKGVMIALAPLLPGSNDPDKLAEMWSSTTGAELDERTTILSAGKQRPALTFTLGGVQQIIVLYIEPTYRVGVLYQAPEAKFDDESFEREVMNFYARNVVMP